MAQLRRGWLLYRLGRYADAIDSYQRAIAAAPKAIEPRVGVLLPRSRRCVATAISRRRVKRCLRSSRTTIWRRCAWRLPTGSGRYAEAVGLYAGLKDLYPSDADVRSGLGWSLLKSGRSAEAIRELRELLSIHPRHALANGAGAVAKRRALAAENRALAAKNSSLRCFWTSLVKARSSASSPWMTMQSLGANGVAASRVELHAAPATCARGSSADARRRPDQGLTDQGTSGRDVDLGGEQLTSFEGEAADDFEIEHGRRNQWCRHRRG